MQVIVPKLPMVFLLWYNNVKKRERKLQSCGRKIHTTYPCIVTSQYVLLDGKLPLLNSEFIRIYIIIDIPHRFKGKIPKANYFQSTKQIEYNIINMSFKHLDGMLIRRTWLNLKFNFYALRIYINYVINFVACF